ncbi:probable protein-S-isoprenylcysteine O-methyltransferase isoform X1 [Selaginella moellendorffii]|uniref:probable protein-S-isoprenylcysteine O-methyltransferase isoform X1 n=1 Tax=Selaginella moellendorffii TaxID=88036 RepID=UPI000D1D0784|nr:probable protein-S-isoprenylcysteine O-methyltransferase isoform X1 [Selaginella moellendorffii]|eukprot:XP_024516450.1 probable protein-S-isoprenylcysteine O-methyltransferase isoform X1 [Selaginella moellendorffii]
MIHQLALLVGALSFFHSSEFALALLIHGRHHVSWKSFLFSRDYLVAMAAGVLEHLAESLVVPGIKEHPWISNAGLALVVAGEMIRKAGILTAWNGFTHDIKTHRHDNHILVTHGMYSFLRHPGYAGFFLWSVGTQVMMLNPLCTIAYAIVTWRFFHSRIAYVASLLLFSFITLPVVSCEEYFLRRFFGSQYEDYARRVPSGIPFIK